ncbi:MAG: FAD-dependent pyridine nucleotide-disulfide oxidoreductase [Halanaerobium sp. 4-GBenrich]|jgi:NADPH-dependent 2,4-dienoyl-CoA reductase/sulfur reductase-like enzyme|uniref:NADPH-dependent 2,4-dienoyl-CoA reductase/sulfur reductase-like enzyme n=1 Tax=Halanaerobium congolense TaxID=54121 RepID=A0A4R7E5T3_9FIRM|nr:FAD-dependent oxidoreductase [Halanaerobium congolense]ODS49643.1 MAG: FAD-dependent pyridine nucleotide-disulfide oxidoreductase [Halanaerobium sp. 4-GBenrich]OEG62155.1 MAG: pyridine nucleotide-disulfide oxidoreductase [Halanaerobium sp. MDAL1]TDS28474.1 NADPH-dependent 2,4-dienoyl-CoA reductase/sulfur reductase-like enzyme [Halanaerobium congolense]SDK84633.1 NADPH-dependent 2,4-dienoyl-CoA reductase, sulfur reductase [Halanaerobium congolense]SDM65467.1 NADPH-dependent 2,4-dienoyl-CoA r
MKIAVIGAVAAGTSAAAKARRTNKDAEIVIFEKGRDISYAGCGLPYYISGVTPSRYNVVMNTAQDFEEKYKVDVRLEHEVTEIDSDEKILYYQNLVNGKEGGYEFDKLIIATGAAPIKPPFEGIDLENIFTLRSVESADQIKDAVKRDDVKRAVIIGAGLIGLEMAESFSELGMDVTVIELEDQVLPPFSKEMAGLVEDHLKEKGVELILGDGVDHFEGEGKVAKVVTGSGREIEADLALLSIGVKANSKLAEAAGIEVGDTGAIKVNEKLETNIKGIYAVGDCAESKDLLTNKDVWVPLGSTANKQGRTAGENAAGGEAKHYGILKTGITKVFDLTVAKTGLDLEEAEAEGINAAAVKVKAHNHASYYPGTDDIYLRGIFDRKNGVIVGAEVIGGDGSDKRIDVLAAAIYNRMTANELFQVDLAYAPPFSGPKDAVAILGMVAEKKL